MSYVDFDEFGILQIRCMTCNAVVASRTYTRVASKERAGVFINVLAMKMHSNKRDIRLELSDGSYTDIISCTACENKLLDIDAITAMIKDAWVKELRWAGKNDKIIQEHKDRVKKLKIKKPKTRGRAR